MTGRAIEMRAGVMATWIRIDRITLTQSLMVVHGFLTRNQVSPGSNPSLLLPFRRLGIFVLSIDAPVHSAVYMSTWL